MTNFSIDADNTITTFASAAIAAAAPGEHEDFTSLKELDAVAANWPADRLVAIWNSFAGVAGFGADLKPVKKFTDRATASKRIWSAIQKLDGVADATAPEAPAAAPKATKTAKGAKKAAKAAPKASKPTKTAEAAKKATSAATPREGSKKQIVLDLLKAKGGATMAEIAKATEWQNHTIRGFISGTLTKKMGLAIESTKNDAGERTYRIGK